MNRTAGCDNRYSGGSSHKAWLTGHSRPTAWQRYVEEARQRLAAAESVSDLYEVRDEIEEVRNHLRTIIQGIDRDITWSKRHGLKGTDWRQTRERAFHAALRDECTEGLRAIRSALR